MSTKDVPLLLAIDPGTNCGYSYIHLPDPTPRALHPVRSQSGIFDMSSDRFQGGGVRFLRLRRFLIEIDPDVIVYEAVRFAHRSTAAAAAYYGIVAVIQEYAEEKGIPYEGIDVGTIKKRATGKGNCGKPPMVNAANEEFDIDPPLNPSKSSKDDNIADAMWICQMGIEIYGDGVLRGRPSKQGDSDE